MIFSERPKTIAKDLLTKFTKQIRWSDRKVIGPEDRECCSAKKYLSRKRTCEQKQGSITILLKERKNCQDDLENVESLMRAMQRKWKRQAEMKRMRYKKVIKFTNIELLHIEEAEYLL